MLLAVSRGAALFFLFVVAPVVLALVIAALVQWRSEPVPAGQRTSEVLRAGTPAPGRLIDWKAAGQSFLDRRPMVTFQVEVRDEPPLMMDVTQSIPRAALRHLQRGMDVQVWLLADGSGGAITFPDQERQP